ncbi:late embryogenesis abundant protein Lea5-like [Dioscorea cayenensis subsp. rotundata]|uniref:Late embryogenesis abundant protein Lea5-like n=1 Tax=Dioscorea cayennensis subsp. rotundata TaxID=55577 RepID=A0AB40BIZ8_DIOCR|nr:late embryogenesis abundant protein Lea5-like [Dioscorea cayenensis subsp. rotundata]
MAHTLASTSLIRVFMDSTGLGISRRCYYASVAAVAAVEEKIVTIKNKKESAGPSASSASPAWVPDPVTGYYRPANSCHGADVTEMRELILSTKSV